MSTPLTLMNEDQQQQQDQRQYLSRRLQDRQIREKQRQEQLELERIERNHRELLERIERNNRELCSVRQFNTILHDNFSLLSSSLPSDFELPTKRRKKEYSDSSSSSSLKYPAYRVLKHNIYKAPLQRPSLSPGEGVSHCSCSYEEGCHENCQNRMLFMECPPYTCPSLHKHDTLNEVSLNERPNRRKRTRVDEDQDNSDSNIINNMNNDEDNGMKDDDENGDDVCDSIYCKNSCIQTRTFPLTEVVKTDNCGFGLRLLEDVEANTMICEYLGEVISPEECTSRMTEYQVGDDFYFASLGQGLMLDAKAMGSIARFANHSCDPNCELQKWMVLGEPHICLVAISKLQKGTDITYNYQYFQDGMEEISKLKRQKCQCGATSCAGTIGGKVKVSASDTWISKANSLLYSSKRYPVEAFQHHISSDVLSSSSVPRACVEIEKVKEVIDKGIEWVRDVKRLVNAILVKQGVSLDLGVLGKLGNGYSDPATVSFEGLNVFDNFDTANMSILTVEIVQELLDKIPRCLKLSEGSYLEQLKEKCIRTNKYILSYEESLNKQEGRQEDRQEGKQEGSVQIRWEDVVAIMKDIHSCLPLKVVNGDKIMELYQDLSHWCHRWLSGLCKNYSSPNIGIKKLDSLTWTTVDAISRVYGFDLSDEPFVVTDFLDDRLYLYMKRLGLMKGDWKEKLENLENIKKSQKYDIDEQFTEMVTENKKLAEETNGDDELHCFCRMPETEGETLTFSQCDSCDRWFHPQCLNQTVTFVVQKIKSFRCPLCLHKGNLCSAYIEAPTIEWKPNPSRKQSGVKAGEKVANTSKGRPPKKCAESLKCHDECPLQGPGKKAERKRSSKLAKSVAGDTLSVQEIEMALADDKMGSSLKLSKKRLVIIGSPPQLLLSMILRFTMKWSERCKKLMSSDELTSFSDSLEVMTSSLSQHSDIGKSGPFVVDNETLSSEANLLEKCLHLYYELRLMRVKTTEVISLRRIIWLISSKTLITTKKCDETEEYAFKPQLVDFRRALEGGTKMLMQDEPTLQIIEKIFNCAESYTSQASHCSAAESAVVMNLLKNFGWVSFDKEYAYARVRSVALAYNKESMSRKTTTSNAVETNANCNEGNFDEDTITRPISDNQQLKHELYCYCQEPDYQGSQYVQCDVCQEWFHFECTGASNKKKLKEMQNYACIACSESKNETYAHKW